jgi:uncharacterized membrane protein YhhN
VNKLVSPAASQALREAPLASPHAPALAGFGIPFVGALVAQALLRWLHEIPWIIAIRPLPAFALALGVARVVPLRRSWLLLFGLILGGAGDAAMALRQRSISNLPLFVAMGLFFAGHVGYAVTFFRERAYRPGRVVWAGSLVVVALGAAWILLPRLGSLAGPVAIYATSLTVMAALAALRGSPRPTVSVGATLFFVSDALIGARLAGAPVPGAVIVLGLLAYYLGQYWIARGWARDALSEGVRSG